MSLKGVTFALLCLCLVSARGAAAHRWLRPLALGWGINLSGNGLMMAWWLIPAHLSAPCWQPFGRQYWELQEFGYDIATLGSGLVAYGIALLLLNLRRGTKSGGSPDVSDIQAETWPPAPNPQ